jgi:hypothetical protein
LDYARRSWSFEDNGVAKLELGNEGGEAQRSYACGSEVTLR